MMIRFFLLLALIWPGALAASEVRFQLEGYERRFQVFAPDDPQGEMPLVLVLHGVFQTDARMIDTTRGKWEEFAKANNFVAVFPNAVNMVWDIGQGAGTFEPMPRRDDIAYLDQVIALTSERYQIDRNRVFMVGFSLGAQMSFAYTCQRGGIRGIATVSMPLPKALLDDCARTPAVPLLSIHGTNDPVIPAEGGDLPMEGDTVLSLISQQETIDIFAGKAGCTGPGELKSYDRRDDATKANFNRWSGCSVPIWTMSIEGLGHKWPGGGPDLPVSVLGRGTEEVEGTAFVWSFFSALK